MKIHICIPSPHTYPSHPHTPQYTPSHTSPHTHLMVVHIKGGVQLVNHVPNIRQALLTVQRKLDCKELITKQ